VNKYFHVYGAIDCPFCIDSVMLLTSLGYEYTLTLIDQSPTHAALIKSAYGHPTIPIITYCNNLDEEEFIGGASELVNFLSKNFEESDVAALTPTEE